MLHRGQGQAAGVAGHPHQVHLRGLVHVVDGDDHEDVHDVVRVEHQVQLAREPLLRYVDCPNVSSNDCQQVLKYNVMNCPWSAPTVWTESQYQTEHSDYERSCEGKAPSPDSGDCHGLVEAEDAHSQVDEQQADLGLVVKAVDGRTDGHQRPQGLGEPDPQQVHLEQDQVGELATFVTHEQVVES